MRGKHNRPASSSPIYERVVWQETKGARVPGFWWEHAEYIAGIETLCPAFAQQEHTVHIWNVIWLCVPNVPISNILFTAGMRPCHVSG